MPSFLQGLIYWSWEQVPVVLIRNESQVQGQSAVTASWTGTLNACWRGHKTSLKTFQGLLDAASMNQEPNIEDGLYVQFCLSFGQRDVTILLLK